MNIVTSWFAMPEAQVNLTSLEMKLFHHDEPFIEDRPLHWLKWNSSLHFCAGQSFSSMATRLAADVWSSLCEVLPSINQRCDHVVSCGKRRPWNTPNLEKMHRNISSLLSPFFVKWTCEIFTLTKGSGVWWDKISLRCARIRSQMDVGVQQADTIYKMVIKMCWWCLDCLPDFYFIYMNTYAIIYEVNIRCSSTQQHIWSLTRIFNSRIIFDNSVGLLFGMGKNPKLVHISESPWYFSIPGMFLWQNLVVLSASRASLQVTFRRPLHPSLGRKLKKGEYFRNQRKLETKKR